MKVIGMDFEKPLELFYRLLDGVVSLLEPHFLHVDVPVLPGGLAGVQEVGPGLVDIPRLFVELRQARKRLFVPGISIQHELEIFHGILIMLPLDVDIGEKHPGLGILRISVNQVHEVLDRFRVIPHQLLQPAQVLGSLEVARIALYGIPVELFRLVVTALFGVEEGGIVLCPDIPGIPGKELFESPEGLIIPV